MGDDAGRPLTRVRPDQFEVSIEGQPRSVLSVDVLRMARGSSWGGIAPTSDASTAVESDAEVPGQVFVLAVDVMSFRSDGSRAAPERSARVRDREVPLLAFGSPAIRPSRAIRPAAGLSALTSHL
jgi:hypothetical protein